MCPCVTMLLCCRLLTTFNVHVTHNTSKHQKQLSVNSICRAQPGAKTLLSPCSHRVYWAGATQRGSCLECPSCPFLPNSAVYYVLSSRHFPSNSLWRFFALALPTAFYNISLQQLTLLPFLLFTFSLLTLTFLPFSPFPLHDITTCSSCDASFLAIPQHRLQPHSLPLVSTTASLSRYTHF